MKSESFSLENTETPVFLRGDGDAKLHIPKMPTLHIIGKMLDETEEADPLDPRIEYKGLDDEGRSVQIFQKEDLGNVVVDEVMIDGESVYKRPTYH